MSRRPSIAEFMAKHPDFPVILDRSLEAVTGRQLGADGVVAASRAAHGGCSTSADGANGPLAPSILALSADERARIEEREYVPSLGTEPNMPSSALALWDREKRLVRRAEQEAEALREKDDADRARGLAPSVLPPLERQDR